MDDKAIGDTRVEEVLRAVVENEVDSCELLQRLETHAGKLSLEHLPSEAIDIAGFSETHLELVVCTNFGQLRLDSRMVRGQTPQFAKRPRSSLIFPTLDKVARGLRQNEHATNENNGPGELNRDGDAVGPRVHAQRRGVIDYGSQEQPNGDGELVSADNSAANPFGSGFGLVQRDEGGDQTDAQAGEETTCQKERQRDGCGLQDHAEGENETRHDEREAAADVVSHEGRGQGAEESPSGEDGDNGGLLGRRDAEIAVGITVAGREGRVKVFHSQDSRDRARVVAEEHAAEGHEGADADGGP